MPIIQMLPTTESYATMFIVTLYNLHLYLPIVLYLQIGNNILTTAGAIVIATAINNSDSAELNELDLTVSS